MDWTEILKREGLTRTEITEKTGIHKSVLSRIFSGERPPSVEVLSTLVDLLHLDAAEALRAAAEVSAGRRVETVVETDSVVAA